MTDDGITITGLTEVTRALQQYPQIAKPIVQETTDAALLGLIPDLAEYPPKKSWQTNRRTGDLGRRWTTAKPEWAALGSGFEGKLGNASPYGEWVQGEAQTLAAATIGWPQANDLLRTAKERIEDMYQAALRRIAAMINRTTM